MLLQTGVTLNYFTKHYANDYIGVLGEFFVQDQSKVGGFPVLDFFMEIDRALFSNICLT